MKINFYWAFFNRNMISVKNSSRIRNRYINKSAMINEDIRSLERQIMGKELYIPHIYLSSIIKDEFFIRI